MPTGRWTVPLALASIAAIMTGCGPIGGDKAERTLRANIELGGGPEAMWYHFTFTANYRGEPFRLSQWVHCGWRSFGGGPFGSAPAITTRAMYPRQIGQRMADGSYIVVRVPEMCHRHRNFSERGEFRPGWQSRVPFSVLPLVTWNDRRPNTRVVEQYVGRGYYRDLRARVTNPRGRIDLMPIGFHPADYETVLRTPEWAASDPDENIDPETGKRWRNLYGYDGAGLYSLYTVPTVDMAAALRRFDEPAEQLLREFGSNDELLGGLDQMVGLVRAGRESLPGYKGDKLALPLSKGVQDARFRLYDDSFKFDLVPLKFDPAYLPPYLISNCIGGLRAGIPLYSNLPVDPYPFWYRRKINLAKAQRDRRQLLAACALLDRLVSFDVRDGRLDGSAAVPGVIVRRHWGRVSWGKGPWPLRDSGVIYSRTLGGWPQVNRFRFGTTAADLELSGEPQILEDRGTNEWHALFLDGYRLAADSYTEGGW